MDSFTHAVRHSLTRLGVLTAHPWAFGALGAFAILWLIFEPNTLDWHAVATLSTLLMTLLIQRAEHRDTQAIHAKVDELLSATKNARTELSKIDEQEPEDIELQRKSGL